MRVPATTDILQETRGNLEVPEIRVWVHPHRVYEEGEDHYEVFESFEQALEFAGEMPGAENTPLVAFRGYELNLWEMQPDPKEEA